MNKELPHKAVINIAFSIYPVTNTGELNGACVTRAQLNESGLKHRLVSVSGSNYEECVIALKNALDRMTKCAQ
jgi:hypothetical protein